MPTKSDRILGYLPGTFRRAPDRSVLFAIVDAFGAELLKGENSLAAVMQAHWVDHADRGAQKIDDLARIAELYGLKPRCGEPAKNGDSCALPPSCDETVEEFREHLKRYVLTFLEGTVTVQGLLRVAAENLGLHIADNYDEIDVWWKREREELVTVHPHRDDVAQYLFGFRRAASRGTDAQPAAVHGTVDLTGDLDLGPAAVLSLSVDGDDAVDIDLLEGASDPQAINLDWIIVALNVALGRQIATRDRGRLSLTSPTAGADSRLEIHTVEGDASEQLLGIKRRAYRGAEGFAAAVTGSPNLEQGVDLSERPYILLSLDGETPVLIDCAGEERSNTQPGEIVTAINSHFEPTVARTDGKRISLISPTVGPESSILFARPPFGDATELIFGIGPHVFSGAEATAAHLRGQVVLDEPLSFLSSHRLRLLIDDEPREIDFRTRVINPGQVSPRRVARLINTALGGSLARIEDNRLVLTSLTAGAGSSVAVEAIETTRRRRFVSRARILDEAAGVVFGFVDQTAGGQPATSAIVKGTKDLSRSVNLSQQRYLSLGIDDAAPIDIDCAGPRPRATLLQDVIDNINSHFDTEIARRDNGHLILQSPTSGEGSRITLGTPVRAHSNARALLLGDVEDEEQGQGAVPAVIKGQVDLLSAVDLSERSLLRIAVNDERPVDIDIAGTTPSATTLGEIIAAINAQVPGLAAATDDDRLCLTAPGDQESSLALLPLRFLEVIEYLPEPAAPREIPARHGQTHALVFSSVANDWADVSLQNASGVAGPGLLNRTSGWRLRYLNALAPGETLKISPHPERGVRLQKQGPDGEATDVRASDVIIGPLGAQALVPFTGSYNLSGAGDDQVASLQLNNPQAPWLIRLRARERGVAGLGIYVTVTAGENGPGRFDVTLRREQDDAEPVEASYRDVSIGLSPNEPGALAWEINAGPGRSSLVTAEFYRKDMILELPQGRSDWMYLDCLTDRYDEPQSRFDEAYFAGGACRETGIFDVSVFAGEDCDTSPGVARAVFAGAPPAGAETEIIVNTIVHRPGTLQVNLPVDLPSRFGGRFDEGRFGQGTDEPELYAGVVVEPQDDPRHLIKQVAQNERSLIQAEMVDAIEPGWEAVPMPFRQPRFLTLGSAEQEARLYLSEEGLTGFILLRAREPGAWGNELAVSARLTGPAMYDVCIVYRGAVFENATAAVAGEPAPVLSAEMLKKDSASAVGILQAAAAGVQASVTREKEGGSAKMLTLL